MNEEEQPARRLFLALCPDESVRQRLLAVVHDKVPDGKARCVAAGNLHLTLVFLGGVTAVTQHCIEQAMTQVAVAPFTMTLDRLGYWPRKRMLWAMPSVCPPQLVELVDVLQKAVAGCGVAPETRPYRAHVTLARKVRQALPDGRMAAIEWPAARFSLMESLSTAAGVQYIERATWLLEAAE